MSETNIEWASHVWNPVRGCSRVSPGCEHCYAETMAARFSDDGFWGHGFAERTKAGPRWTRKVALIPEKLAEPLRWRKPRRVFVNSMSDLFHEKLSNKEIAAIFGVMAAAPTHQFLTLTKRAGRMREWFEWVAQPGRGRHVRFMKDCAVNYFTDLGEGRWIYRLFERPSPRWPLPNVWLGVSAEDQERWDDRVPELLRCPAAVRFVSAEPLLGPLDTLSAPVIDIEDAVKGESWIDWIVVGGESGPRARPCRVEWIRDIVEQCREAGVACFVKQMGAKPTRDIVDDASPFNPHDIPLHLKDKKGGDPAEWPAGDWPRDYPEAAHA